jgi:DNA polymerase I-like protein with 3'-5' exonuclease and polymerase domains
VNPADYARLSAAKEAGTLKADAEKALLKRLSVFRNIAKSAGFAICYMAGAQTVWQRIIATGLQVKLTEIEAMLQALKAQFAAYYAWQDRRLLDIVRTGLVDEPLLGRTRWLGHDPAPTEAANFPIQAGAASIMNTTLPRIVDALRRESSAIKLVAQVHDAGVFDVPLKLVDVASRIMIDLNHEPVVLDSSGSPLSAVYPIDLEKGERWK